MPHGITSRGSRSPLGNAVGIGAFRSPVEMALTKLVRTRRDDCQVGFGLLSHAAVERLCFTNMGRGPKDLEQTLSESRRRLPLGEI